MLDVAEFFSREGQRSFSFIANRSDAHIAMSLHVGTLRR